MELRLKVIDIKTGKEKDMSQREIVLDAFKYLGEGTDWEVLEWIEKNYQIDIVERNWVSARRGDLMDEGLIESTENKRKGEFGKDCTVWRFNPQGKKEALDCLTSNEMNRVIKKLSEYCRKANDFQRKKMLEVIQHYD